MTASAPDGAARTFRLPGRWGSFGVSPDGSLVATANDGDDVVLWEVASCKPLGPPLKRGGEQTKRDFWHGGRGTPLVFGPDGKTLLAGLNAWRVPTGEFLGTLPGPSSNYYSGDLPYLFSPDGTVLFVDGKAQLIPWSVTRWAQAGAPLSVPDGGFLSNEPGNHYTAQFSPDSRILALAMDESVILWDVVNSRAAGLLHHPHKLQRGIPAMNRGALVFSPDGRTLATVGEQEALLWDIASQRCIGVLSHPGGGLASALAVTHSRLTFSPDGRIVVWRVGWDATPSVYIWDVTRARLIAAPFRSRAWSIVSVAFSEDGKRLASGGYDHPVALWDLTGADFIGSPRSIGDLQKGFGSSWLAFSPDGTTLAAQTENGLLFWDVSGADSVLLARMEGEPLVLDNGVLLVGAKDQVLLVDLNRAGGPSHPAVLARGDYRVATSSDRSAVVTYIKGKQDIAVTVWPAAALASRVGREK